MALSPMMQQYFDIKEQNKDRILFFRLGDFYEMFFDDAKLVSRELDLVLTGRDCGQEERAPMCGVPYHSCDAYIARLIKKGYKVAICEQVEDPKVTKGIVKREVVRVITPGTLIEDNMLEEGANNYIASIYLTDKSSAVAFADISTGQVFLTNFDCVDLTLIKNELLKFSPKEVIFNDRILSYNEFGIFLKEKLNCCAEVIDNQAYYPVYAKDLIAHQFGNEITLAGAAADNADIVATLGALLHYLNETQKSGVERLVSVERYSDKRFINLDLTARRNLELTQTMRSGEKRGSLLWVMDKTKTAMGKRLLRRYIEQPLCQPVAIEKRLNAVEEIYSDTMLRLDLEEELAGIFDIERLLTRIVCATTNPRELYTFAQALKKLPQIKGLIANCKAKLLGEIFNDLDPLEDISQEILDTISQDPPATIKEGWFIREGFNQNLDEIRKLLTNTKEVLAQIETDERERTGIKNLKIGYNKVFGYYIEITNSYKEMAPPEYIRKQTLSNCERYITQQLKELEDKILSARERVIVLETSIYETLRQNVAEKTQRIQKTADAISRLDVFSSFAQLATNNNYNRPVITTDGTLMIKEGRHPVVEQLLKSSQPFVANDCLLDLNENQIAIITGPNMAGKSTYIRQTALIVLMAQMGSFVPANSATVGVVDGIFTRVGASDDLSTGQSTFMVEMSEVAQILKSATKNSLIILDEVGRGTSTFDGMSIARAIIEFLADKKRIGAKTLFATHYHELTELEEILPCVKNYNTAVKKRGDDITFLRRIVAGSIDDSYGIEVSKLAGIPQWIISRAHEILEDLEQQRPIEKGKIAVKYNSLMAENDLQTQLPKLSAVEESLKAMDLNILTPLDALNKLYELKAML